MTIQIVLSIHGIVPKPQGEWCKPQDDYWTDCLGDEFRGYTNELPLWQALCEYAKETDRAFYIDLTDRDIESFLREIDNDDLQFLKDTEKGKIQFVVPLEKWLQNYEYYEERLKRKLKVVYPDWRRTPNARIWDALDEKHRECIKQLVQGKTGCENAFPILTKGDMPLVRVIGGRPEWFAERFPEYVKKNHIPPSLWELVKAKKFGALISQMVIWLKQEYNDHQFGILFTLSVMAACASWGVSKFELVFFTGILTIISIVLLWKSSSVIRYGSKRRLVVVGLVLGGIIFWLSFILLSVLYIIHFWFFARQTTVSMVSPRLTLTIFHPYWISEGDEFDVELYIATRDMDRIDEIELEVRKQTANLQIKDIHNLLLEDGQGAHFVQGRMYVSNSSSHPTRAAFSVKVVPKHKDYDYKPIAKDIEMRVYPWAFGVGRFSPFRWLDKRLNFQFPKYHLRDNSREFLLLFVQVFFEFLFVKLVFIIIGGLFADEHTHS